MGRYLKTDASFPEAMCTVYNLTFFNDDGLDNITHTCSSTTITPLYEKWSFRFAPETDVLLVVVLFFLRV